MTQKIKSYDYPKRYDEHMLKVPFKRDYPNLDENYKYRDKTFKGRLSRSFTYFLCKVVAFPLIALLTGLKIFGRENLKKHKELLKGGAITICNHVHMWDMICLLKAIRPVRNYHPAWATNLRGPNDKLIRGCGGMPVPGSVGGLKAFSNTLDEIMEEGGWLHFFPEGSLWFYYDAIRPFKRGAFATAVKHNKPILPVCINYRPAKGIGKIFTKENPYFLSIHVGEPLMPNLSLPKREAADDLLERSRSAMQKLSQFNKIIPQNEQERSLESES